MKAFVLWLAAIFNVDKIYPFVMVSPCKWVGLLAVVVAVIGVFLSIVYTADTHAGG